MIKKILQDLVILVENVYNMDKAKVMLFMSSSIKVLVDKNDIQDYKGVRIKRTTMIAIEYISVDDRYLTSMII